MAIEAIDTIETIDAIETIENCSGFSQEENPKNEGSAPVKDALPL